MVLPNGLLAFYYARRGNPEVVYTSQVGDGHICIPLCIGIYALYRPIQVPPFFQTGVVILLVAAALAPPVRGDPRAAAALDGMAPDGGLRRIPLPGTRQVNVGG